MSHSDSPILGQSVCPGQIWELRIPDHEPLRRTVAHVYYPGRPKDAPKHVAFVDDILPTTVEHLLSSPEWRLIEESDD